MSSDTPSTHLRTFWRRFESSKSNEGASGVSGNAAKATVSSFEKALYPILLEAVVLNL